MSGFTKSERQSMIETFNSRGFTFGGVPVRASGISAEFPSVYVKRGHPLFGFACEYSWGTLQRICEGDKQDIAVAP